ncbi:acid-sensing ion channel 2-like [Pomacea canaliculata]|uniref:acid-sensing ion channel 2-like n=1 Tax=Pomacea canaliculata TaxID=400727 RepID=UPI000D737671|nr:acid-sensing ion channel 2-like [Pomacea canaliculata]
MLGCISESENSLLKSRVTSNPGLPAGAWSDGPSSRHVCKPHVGKIRRRRVPRTTAHHEHIRPRFVEDGSCGRESGHPGTVPTERKKTGNKRREKGNIAELRHGDINHSRTCQNVGCAAGVSKGDVASASPCRFWYDDLSAGTAVSAILQVPHPDRRQPGLQSSPLPAVTICNANMVRLSQAYKLSCLLQDALGVPNNTDCSHGNIDLNDVPNFGCVGDCKGKLDNTTINKHYYEMELANTSRQLLKEVGHQSEDMILSCFITGIYCDYRDFTHSLSYYYGNCYTLSRPKLKSTTTGPLEGLFLQLNIESDEYLSTEESGYGLRVVLHENGTRPNPANKGFTVRAGSEVFVAIRMVNVNSQGPPYGSCDNGEEYKQKTGNNYTIEGCRDLCIKTAVLQNCSCVPLQDDFALLLNDSFCRSDEEIDCLDSFSDNYYDGLNNGNDPCACSKPCSESTYQATVTSHPWPLFKEVRKLENQICQVNPHSPKCDYQDQSFTVDTYELRRSSFMRLHVYYDSLNYDIITEKPAYEVERFLSDIGGTLGLWIGASVLGLGELLEIVILLLVRCHRAKKRDYHVTSPASPVTTEN